MSEPNNVSRVVREVVFNADFTVNPNEALVPVFVDLVRVQADGTKVVPSIYPNGDLRYTKSEMDCVENGTFRVTSLGGKTLAVFPVSGAGAVKIARAERDRLIHAQDYAAASFRDRVLKPLEELERKREDRARAKRDTSTSSGSWIGIADVIGAWNEQKLTREQVYARLGMNVPTDADVEALVVPQSMTVNGVAVHAGDRISVTSDDEVIVSPPQKTLHLLVHLETARRTPPGTGFSQNKGAEWTIKTDNFTLSHGTPCVFAITSTYDGKWSDETYREFLNAKALDGDTAGDDEHTHYDWVPAWNGARLIAPINLAPDDPRCPDHVCASDHKQERIDGAIICRSPGIPSGVDVDGANAIDCVGSPVHLMANGKYTLDAAKAIDRLKPLGVVTWFFATGKCRVAWNTSATSCPAPVDQPACTCGCPFYLHRYAWEKTGKAYGCDNGGCSCGEYRASTQVTLPNGNADVVTSSLRADYDSVGRLLDEYDPKWRQVDGGTTHVNALRKVVMQKDAKIKFDAETRRAQDVEIVNLRSRAEVLRTALRMLYDATSDPKTGLRNSDAAVRAKQALCRYLPDGSPAGNELCVDCTCGHPASWHTVRPMTLGRHACLVCDDGSATGCRDYRPASVQVDFKRGVPVVDDVMRAWMNAAHAQGLAEAKKLSEMIIDAGHKCMVCSNAIGTRIVHVSVYGGETAVLACPNCDAFGYAIEKFGAEGAHSVKLKGWRPVGKFTDVRRDADGVSGTFHAFAEIKEEPPMPTTKPAPDPHAECRLSLRDGILVDDYGRPLKEVYALTGEGNANDKLNFSRVKMTVELSKSPPDAWASRPAAQPEPIILECSESVSIEHMRGIDDAARAAGMSVILLPPSVRRAKPPEEDALRADISRRADLGDAYRRGKRVGLAFGAVALALFVGLSVTVARVRPAWAMRAVMWVAGQGR